jgi:hypothetical protein
LIPRESASRGERIFVYEDEVRPQLLHGVSMVIERDLRNCLFTVTPIARAPPVSLLLREEVICNWKVLLSRLGYIEA